MRSTASLSQRRGPRRGRAPRGRGWARPSRAPGPARGDVDRRCPHRARRRRRRGPVERRTSVDDRRAPGSRTRAGAVALDHLGRSVEADVGSHAVQRPLGRSGQARRDHLVTAGRRQLDHGLADVAPASGQDKPGRLRPAREGVGRARGAARGRQLGQRHRVGRRQQRRPPARTTRSRARRSARPPRPGAPGVTQARPRGSGPRPAGAPARRGRGERHPERQVGGAGGHERRGDGEDEVEHRDRPHAARAPRVELLDDVGHQRHREHGVPRCRRWPGRGRPGVPACPGATCSGATCGSVCVISPSPLSSRRAGAPPTLL